jgi:SAM-dependent methyltransferase
MDNRTQVAAEHWAQKRSSNGARWWDHPAIHRHINRLVCGDAIDGPHQGFHQRIRVRNGGVPFRRAASVGCGSGGKEIGLLRQNLVEHFELFEIGEFRRDQILAKATEHGVADRVTVYLDDAFAHDFRGDLDLVYWNNSLHHMFDVAQAVAWSHRGLRSGGCFAMDDFVGPSRFQWSDDDLDLAFRVRDAFPDDYLIHPRNPAARIPKRQSRPALDQMMETDPTEAADSASILDAVRKTFPDAEIVGTGGIVYHLALNDVLANFDEERDAALLQSLLLLDETLAAGGRTHYAVAIATR